MRLHVERPSTKEVHKWQAERRSSPSQQGSRSPVSPTALRSSGRLAQQGRAGPYRVRDCEVVKIVEPSAVEFAEEDED
jgi:hypothetical protein